MGVITETDDDVVNEQGTTHKNQLFCFCMQGQTNQLNFRIRILLINK